MTCILLIEGPSSLVMSATFLFGAIDVLLSSDSLSGGGRRTSPWHLGQSHVVSLFFGLVIFTEEALPSMPPFFASIAAMPVLPVCSTADDDVDEPQENIDVGRERPRLICPPRHTLSISLFSP